MPWIRTLSLDDADDKVLKAMAQQRALYPPEYAQPVQELPGLARDRGLAYLDSRGSLSCFRNLRRAHIARVATAAPAARDDRHHGLPDQQVPLLNCLARRVSASGHPG